MIEKHELFKMSAVN